MAEMEQRSSSTATNCIFCRIVSGQTDTELLHDDREFACFRDIKPHATHHFLIVPKTHLPNVKYLSGTEHVEIVRKMVEVGREVLMKEKGDAEDCLMGFHWPPFNSVPHLHLHVLAPYSQMSFLSRKIIFRKESWFFVTVEWALNYIQSK